MKILFQSRVDLYKPRGGDTIQMEKTKMALEKMFPDVEVDISVDLKDKNIDRYDIIHLFNLDWVCEPYIQINYAKQHKKPVVYSAIHHSEEDVLKYEKLARYDIRRIYNFLVASQALRDTWKNFYRSIFNSKKMYPTIVQLLKGIRNQQREIISKSDIILVQSDVEAELIRKDFSVHDFRYKKVVNGVDRETFDSATPEEFNKHIKQSLGIDISDKNVILNVGRIEPRKNQLSLINAYIELKRDKKIESDWVLIFIGDFSDKSIEYKMRFLGSVKNNKNILYAGRLSQSLVSSAMAHNGIYVHPSWFESTGLVCLEAALSGMKVVSTGDPIKEYLEKDVISCKPESVSSIKTAILEAIMDGTRSSEYVKEKIKKCYSWDEVARQTMSIYNEISKI